MVLGKGSFGKVGFLGLWRKGRMSVGRLDFGVPLGFLGSWRYKDANTFLEGVGAIQGNQVP
jgi:hypothetical protein